LSFQLALQHQFPKTNVNALTPEEFKELITTHLQKSIMIIANDASELTIDSISIALGHEVLVMGKLNSTVLFYSISSQVFASMNDHFIILSIVQDGKEMMKTVLNNENEFTAQVNGINVPALVKSAEVGYRKISLYAFFVILMVAFFFILRSKC
jgi:ABC-type branched-subunit amino acid transport system permease subunit